MQTKEKYLIHERMAEGVIDMYVWVGTLGKYKGELGSTPLLSHLIIYYSGRFLVPQIFSCH